MRLTESEVLEFARDEIEKHGLDCPVRFTRMKSLYGQIWYGYYNGERACKEIRLSRPLFHALEDPYEMLETVLHEIAHGVAWLKYRDRGHGHTWKMIAQSMGIAPERCRDAVIDESKLRYKYTATCPNCGKGTNFDRMGKRWKIGRACGRCCGKHSGGVYDKRFALVIKQNH